MLLFVGHLPFNERITFYTKIIYVADGTTVRAVPLQKINQTF